MAGRDDFGFVSGASASVGLRLLGFRGRESISSLFEYELLLERGGGAFSDDEIDALLAAPCAISLGETRGDVVRGVLMRMKCLERPRGGVAHYTATMAPTMALLELAKHNRIFQNLDVLEIAATVFAQYRLAPEVDYRIATATKVPKREFVTQYDETDWAFLSRWFEHEGIRYWFEHGGDGGELMVIGDDNGQSPRIEAPSSLRYRERNTLSTDGEATVFDWELEERRVSARVVLVDYNYRTPHVRLGAKAAVDSASGFGTVTSYGDHFKTNQEAQALANVRAERFGTEHRTYEGRTDCARLRAGHVFELEGPLETTHEQAYLVTEVSLAGGAVTPDGEYERYHASFRAIPLATPFRPARHTPWPRIHGFMHGHIAADGPGIYAQMDEFGRYRVKFPFDTMNTHGSAASRWIRMAEPYAGAAEGSHHPLRKGTEVVVAFLDGDPDRPLIVASVPNAHTVSPTTRANATQAVMRTPSGIRVEIEDLEKSGAS